MRGSFGQPSNHSAAVLGRRRASIEALANSSWDDEALPRSDLAKLKERKAEEDLKAKKEEKKEEEPRRGQLPIPKDLAKCLADLTLGIGRLQAELEEARKQSKEKEERPLPPAGPPPGLANELQGRHPGKLVLEDQWQASPTSTEIGLPGSLESAFESEFGSKEESPNHEENTGSSSPDAGSVLKKLGQERKMRRVGTQELKDEFGTGRGNVAAELHFEHLESRHDTRDFQSLSCDKINQLKSDPHGLEEYEKSQFKDAIKQLFEVDPSDTLLRRFVNGVFFKAMCMIAIGTNTCYLGIAADWNVRNSFKPIDCAAHGLVCGKDPEATYIDIVFAAWFGTEIVLRILVDGCRFFTNDEKYWNIFDFLLVAESLASLTLNTGNLSLLRIFRVFRLIRIVRLVRTVKALRRLRTMIFSILNSFVDLLWAIVVVILIIYIFSIIFSNAVALYFDEVNMGLDDLDNGNKTLVIQQATDVNTEFGDLYSSILALWSAVSGGNDWMMYGSLLRGISHGELYFVIFNFYIAFCVIGMFNVVTGVFVDSAVCCRTEDEVVQGYIDDLRNTTREIKSFFQTADTDRSGTLTYEEFKKQLDDPLVKAYFSGLDIDPSEASIIFAILDADTSDELKIDEFVNGTMKLKGAATKLDVMTMMFDNTKQTIKFNNLCEFVEHEFSDIRKGLLLLARNVQEVRTDAAAAIELSAAAASPPASPSAASPAPPETTAPSLLHEEDGESRRPRSGHPSRRKQSSIHRVPSSAIRVRPRSCTPDSRAEGEDRSPSPERRPERNIVRVSGHEPF